MADRVYLAPLGAVADYLRYDDVKMAQAVEAVVAELVGLREATDRIRQLHAPMPIYDQCIHGDCEDSWEAGNGDWVCGPKVGTACSVCCDEDGSQLDFPCPTVAILDGDPNQ